MDFWASKYHSVKSYSTTLHPDNYLVLDEFEEGDDSRACFPCPFCYEDIEVNVLCLHLQEEHCFDLRNAVCPLCAANLGRDPTGHFVVQHASSLKRRRKSLKPGIWTNTPPSLGSELCSFLGSSTNGSKHESAPEPHLSQSDPERVQQDERYVNIKSNEQSSLDGQVEDKEERRQRAEFVTQLVASIIL